MIRLLPLFAMAAAVALISLSASWAVSQSIWLPLVLVSSGVLAADFVRSISKRSPKVASSEDGSSAPARAVRFAIGSLTLACMTVSMLWFLGLTNS